MKIIFLLLVPFFLYALSNKSCYTVQLISAYKNQKNFNRLDAMQYDKSCKLMEIGKMLTVRCGCFDHYKEAQHHMGTIQNGFKHPFVTTTYRSRFDDVEKNEQKLSPSTIALPEKTIDDIPTLPTSLVATTVTTPKITPSVNKLKKNKNIVVNSKKEIKSVEKKEKKKKTKKRKKKHKKEKVVKKFKTRYFYDRYIPMFKHDEYGHGPYDYRYAFGAQISYDMAYVMEADRDYFDHDYRRVRVYHDGSFFHKSLFYELEYSFTGQNHYKDIFVGYTNKVKKHNLKYRLKGGNLKIPFSLERYTSSKYNTFMERSLNDVFYISRKVGAEFLLSKKMEDYRLNLFGAYYTNSIDERRASEVNKPGYSTRVTLAKKFAKRDVAEIGFGFRYQDYKGENLKMKQAAESNLVEDKYVSVKIKDVNSINTFNLETLFIKERFYMQAEYVQNSIDSLDGLYNFYAYYLQGSYFLKGRGKRYKFSTSTLGNIKPLQGGAVELAMRYSYIDLNDKDEHGGSQRDLTFGINWYLDDNLKISGNYIIANPKETDDYDGIFQVLQARVLFYF